MFGIIVGTHGIFAEEIVKSCEMICGAQTNVRTATLVPGEGPDEMVDKYADLAKKYGDIVQAQEALTKIPSKEETPSYEWVDFDDYDEDDHKLQYNSANGALYNDGMIANGTMRDLADLLYMEVMGLDYPTTARVNTYPYGSTRETEPEEIRVSIYFDPGDTYGFEDE